MDYGIGVIVSSTPKVYLYFLADEVEPSKSLEDYNDEAIEKLNKHNVNAHVKMTH